MANNSMDWRGNTDSIRVTTNTPCSTPGHEAYAAVVAGGLCIECAGKRLRELEAFLKYVLKRQWHTLSKPAEALEHIERKAEELRREGGA